MAVPWDKKRSVSDLFTELHCILEWLLSSEVAMPRPKLLPLEAANAMRGVTNDHV